MSDDLNSLIASTHAFSESTEDVYLLRQKENVEQALTSDKPAQVLDTSQALLEGLFKTILLDRQEKLHKKTNPNIKELCAEATSKVKLSHHEQVHNNLKKLINGIVEQLRKLRNDFGSASHGKDGQFENPIQMPEAAMIARIVDSIFAFLYCRHKASKNRKLAVRVSYEECSDFNGWFDEEQETIAINTPDGSQLLFLASEVLFKNDKVAYHEAFLEFLSWRENEEEEEEESMALEK
ncbi:MAG: abortive infection family protein [Cyanobacteria bacterium J06581_3]